MVLSSEPRRQPEEEGIKAEKETKTAARKCNKGLNVMAINCISGSTSFNPPPTVNLKAPRESISLLFLLLLLLVPESAKINYIFNQTGQRAKVYKFRDNNRFREEEKKETRKSFAERDGHLEQFNFHPNSPNQAAGAAAAAERPAGQAGSHP